MLSIIYLGSLIVKLPPTASSLKLACAAQSRTLVLESVQYPQLPLESGQSGVFNI